MQNSVRRAETDRGQVRSRIAMPVFENRISPRFDCAPTLILSDVVGQKITGREEIFCGGWSDIERISKLKELGVDTLICGGLPNQLQSILLKNGVDIIPWIAGNADEVLDRFLQGRLNSGMVVNARKGRRAGCKKESGEAG